MLERIESKNSLPSRHNRQNDLRAIRTHDFVRREQEKWHEAARDHDGDEGDELSYTTLENASPPRAYDIE